ncbi:MAG: CRISPR-associated endonuclease Cas3'' [Aestuariivita sp.]|nr:CRISPR-associated endonuclease Cas3'' [Aestuariivita sp.]
MREIIAVCRSSKRARDRVARVLDRYFWRIGDRTWRGNASNACLDRVSRELRRKATRNTAVVIHEIRSAHESRVPIIRIGARHAFSNAGIAPIASRPALIAKARSVSSNRAVVQIAALFHDLGKATNLFQKKLQCALQGGKLDADAVRHELFSVAVWDHLFGTSADDNLAKDLLCLTREKIDTACNSVCDVLTPLVAAPDKSLGFNFLKYENRLSYAVAMLIFTHHRLPDGDSDLLQPLASAHVRTSEDFNASHDLQIAPGIPFWHESWWFDALHRNAELLQTDSALIGLDIFLRAALMMGDHLGSSQKRPSHPIAGHLANTIREKGSDELLPADSLSQHVRRVHSAARHGVDLFERYANRFPALDEGEMPAAIAFPVASKNPQFRWQSEAAVAARSLCERNEGGFFACLMAGTGTGKTRGAPTVLAGAAFGDVRPERRYFRISLGLGLRVLATQSAKEYVSDLGFNDQDVSVLVGQTPLTFLHDQERDDENETGSESLIEIPDWLKVETATGGVPDPGDRREADWLRTLSLDTGRALPAFCERFLQATGSKANNGRRLLVAPIMVGTIDHLMDVASPVNSRYLLQSLRVATADLILDEIDQFNGEDIAAIGRLIYQTAAAGRRVIIMSATLTPDIASALHAAYREGWTQFAAAHGLIDHVNLLVTGDAPESCRTNVDGDTLKDILEVSTHATIQALATTKPARRATILPACTGWQDLVDQIENACQRLHNLNAVDIDGFRVSFGMIRMTRIAHTAALAAQLFSGESGDRLRMTLCLHSQFPRLTRSWIETRLKHALTRKCEEDPNGGLRSLCHAEGIFKRAYQAKTRNIEIVLVTSPVIETGNDLDFDWAILDPISTRSIIQAAGRVWRHRPVVGNQTNVMILGRSPIAIQIGKLAMPGVETKLHKATGVPTPSLCDFEGRLFKELSGTADFSAINATPILEKNTVFPLWNREVALREKLVAAGHDSAGEAPLGRYIRRVAARMTQRMARTRRFRRSDAHSILFRLVGDDLETAEWYRDLSPGTRNSDLQPVNENKFDVHPIKGCHLFQRMTVRAWEELYTNEHPTWHHIGHVMQVEIDDYKDDSEPAVTYNDFTGFTRGSFKDLFGPFGKVI